MSGSVGQSARPTKHTGSSIFDRVSPPIIPHPMTTDKLPSNSSVPRLCFPRLPNPRTIAPRNKSKLSITFSNTSETDTSDVEPLYSSCESSDDDSDTLPNKPLPRKPTISRLSFPFVKSAKSPPPLRATKPATSHVSSSPLPSSQTTPSLSPTANEDVKLQNPCIQPPIASPSHLSCNKDGSSQCSSYCHHGYSRHALAHIKCLWEIQEKKWEDELGPVRRNRLQSNVSFLETALDDPFVPAPHSPNPKSPMYPVHQHQHDLPPMTVHPRRGDLATLRDPYCTQIDRSFVAIPSWSIGKMLWMYDVHLASQNRGRSDAGLHDLSDTYYETESENDSPDTAASSTIFSDDSDATLVDSETESEPSIGQGNARPFRDQDLGHKHIAFPRITLASSSLLQDRNPACTPSDTNSSFIRLHMVDWSRSAYSEPTRPSQTSGKALVGCSSWPRNWHRRWECIIETLYGEQSPDRGATFFTSDRLISPSFS